jgi:hypothetical protein
VAGTLPGQNGVSASKAVHASVAAAVGQGVADPAKAVAAPMLNPNGSGEDGGKQPPNEVFFRIWRSIVPSAASSLVRSGRSRTTRSSSSRRRQSSMRISSTSLMRSVDFIHISHGTVSG